MNEQLGVYFWIPDCSSPLAAGHYMKIGRSKDLLKRASGIQTGCPYPLLQLWGLWVSEMEPVELERHLHDQFKKFHMHHEWFQIPTIHWMFFQKNLTKFFSDARLEKVIDNGPLRADYLPPGLSFEKASMVVEQVSDGWPITEEKAA